DRQIRFAKRLSKFNVKLSYRPGVQNGAADALSRLLTSEEEEEGRTSDPILPPRITLATFTVTAINEQVHLQRQDDRISKTLTLLMKIYKRSSTV
ncbi:hypothetical protein BGZ83_004712, partial [Gryganskiella cystojenkinii]